MRQDPGKVPGKPPSLPAPTCSEHTEPSAESGSLQSPCEGQPGISCLKNRRQASTSHLLLAEVQFRVGSEGPGSVSTGASLPWPRCPGLGGAYGEVPSRDPRCKVNRSRGQRQPGPHTRLVSPSASVLCPERVLRQSLTAAAVWTAGHSADSWGSQAPFHPAEAAHQLHFCFPPVPGSLLVLYPSPRPTLLVPTLLLCLHEVNLFFGVCTDHTVFISSCLADVT